MFKHLQQKKGNFDKSARGAEFLLTQSDVYLRLLQLRLDALIDVRLGRTFFDLFMAILTFRNRAMGLLLSELGGYICGFAHAPAGTKRISNLLRCKGWTSALIDDFLFERAKVRICALQALGKRPLLLWDDSRLEKPESWFCEGLCSVHSSKGKRLTKVKRGFYRPPVSRICVPGFQWTGILLSTLGGVPSVCQMRWWTTRGKFQELGTNILYRMLRQVQQQVGRAALHIFDRGYANSEMIEWLLHFGQDFLIRWKMNHLLVNTKGKKKKMHLLARSYNAPMYLLTSLPIQSPAQAWEICFSYMHRWNIEQAFRFGKSELAMESPRLWFWENRLKLLAIVTLVFDFLLRMIQNWAAWVSHFLRNWGHRTGNRYRNASIPIYRLRIAIANCFNSFVAQNSG